MHKSIPTNKVFRLPNAARTIINHYHNLQIGGKHIQTPYYINSTYTKPMAHGKVLVDIPFHYVKKKTKKRSLIGKGNPQEIEAAVNDAARKEQFNVETASAREIKQFMEMQGIGIDCSGLVVWVLNEFTKETFGKPLWNYITYDTKSFVKKLIVRFRPVENISVKVLSSQTNAQHIPDIMSIRVGDMIIGWWDEHVLLITEVGVDTHNKPTYFEYINSTWWYGEKNGVLKGKVCISNPTGYLLDQTWDDFQDGKNWTVEGIKHEGKIVRLLYEASTSI